MDETWRDILGYEGLYQISDLGNVRSLDRKKRNGKDGKGFYILKGRVLTLVNSKKGYKVVTLYKDGKQKVKEVHRLIAEAFIPNEENKPQVNHINGDKTDNSLNNLEWVTVSENIQHAFDNGLVNIKNISGEKNSQSKLKYDDVKYIRRVFIKRDRVYGASALARKYGVSHQNILNIVNNKNWTSLSDEENTN
jgi:DNA invertase Pin-like site-specific DNA recombinase